MQRIGIFGGSFNPVHLEHINMAHIAIKELKLDKLFVMPTFSSPHKSSMSVSPLDRLNMLKLAFLGQDKIEVSDYEIEKKGKSFSFITAEYFRSLYPDSEIFWICGGDMLADFKRWKNPERILKAVELASFLREDYFVDLEKEHKYFRENFNSDFIEINYKGKKYSSTRIRVYSGLGLSLEGLTDSKVIEYIEKNKLYSGNEYFEYVKKVLPLKRLIHTAEVVIKADSIQTEFDIDQPLPAGASDMLKRIDWKAGTGIKITYTNSFPAGNDFTLSNVKSDFIGIPLTTKVMAANSKDQKITIATTTDTASIISDSSKIDFSGKLNFPGNGSNIKISNIETGKTKNLTSFPFSLLLLLSLLILLLFIFIYNK